MDDFNDNCGDFEKMLELTRAMERRIAEFAWALERNRKFGESAGANGGGKKPKTSKRYTAAVRRHRPDHVLEGFRLGGAAEVIVDWLPDGIHADVTISVLGKHRVPYKPVILLEALCQKKIDPCDREDISEVMVPKKHRQWLADYVAQETGEPMSVKTLINLVSRLKVVIPDFVETDGEFYFVPFRLDGKFDPKGIQPNRKPRIGP